MIMNHVILSNGLVLQQAVPPPPPPPMPIVPMPQNPPLPSEPFTIMDSQSGASAPLNYSGASATEIPHIKQTWDEFCLEQLYRANSGRHTTQNNFLNPVTLSYGIPATALSENYRSTPQAINSRNRWRYKRPLAHDAADQEPMLKTSKKKKKPLSHSIPTKKEWAMEDAERALAIERDCNKRSKSSLIIKFPDIELNRDIVAGYHPAIENVHFQQPSTPRFCFVTLKDSANTQEVLDVINKLKFGDSHLVAEHKKDREEDQTISARDLDPFTLYVGNLAQEITKDDMVQLYPHSRRIDIGYAKKMKYTRYAFVVFHTIDTAIEAFQRTHNHQIYNKSLIVRFRRLHGTVGMPGDSKQQNPPKQATPENMGTSHTQSEDLVELGQDNRVSPFPIKEELQGHFDDDYHYDDDDEYADANLVHRPKSIKFEVKGEPEPEDHEHMADSKLGIKKEVKQEQRYPEPEFNEFSDADDLDLEDEYYGPEEDAEYMLQTPSNQQNQITNLRSTS